MAITKLEARQLVVDADSVLNNVKISRPNQVYREKWQQIVNKNPDLQVVVNSTLFASVPTWSVFSAECLQLCHLKDIFCQLNH